MYVKSMLKGSIPFNVKLRRKEFWNIFSEWRNFRLVQFPNVGNFDIIVKSWQLELILISNCEKFYALVSRTNHLRPISIRFVQRTSRKLPNWHVHIRFGTNIGNKTIYSRMDITQQRDESFLRVSTALNRRIVGRVQGRAMPRLTFPRVSWGPVGGCRVASSTDIKGFAWSIIIVIANVSNRTEGASDYVWGETKR